MAPMSFAVFLLSVGLSDSLSISVYLQFLLRLLTKLPTSTQFAEQVLRLLTEERRAIHRERANESRNAVPFAVGDLVMARVQVNSDAASGTVAKLAYRKRGPYEIVESTGFVAYLVRKHGHPTAPLLKYPTHKLFLHCLQLFFLAHLSILPTSDTLITPMLHSQIPY